MAITLLYHLLPKYGAFYSSLMTRCRVIDMTWVELVPMVLGQEECFRSTVSRGGSKALIGQVSRSRD
eukprot:c42183_g1_i1 orf=163-363(+)